MYVLFVIGGNTDEIAHEITTRTNVSCIARLMCFVSLWVSFGVFGALLKNNHMEYRVVHCNFDVLLNSYQCFLMFGAPLSKYQCENT